MGDPMQQQTQQIVTQQVIPGVLPPQQQQPPQMPQTVGPGPGQGQWVPAGQQMPTGPGMPSMLSSIPTGPPTMGLGPTGPEMTASMGAMDDNMGAMPSASAAQKMSERMRLDERELSVTPAKYFIVSHHTPCFPFYS